MKFPVLKELYSYLLLSPYISTDTRQIIPNSIFFSLRGDLFNGNEFAEKALAQGCRLSVVDDENYYKDERYILVKNSLETLQALAKYHRAHCNIPLIAITGSNGKTTTKELVKCVLDKKYNVLATKGNLNNHIGVPLTLLSITPQVEIAIIEMGANHVGEIARLCEIAQPNYGIITNIGKAHLGEFGSYEKVIQAKIELYQHLQNKQGKVFINIDNGLLMSHAANLDKITYGSSTKADCPCKLIESNPYLQVLYRNEKISSRLIGKYNFDNIAAAIGIGSYFKVEYPMIKEAIEQYIPSNNRSQVVDSAKGNTLILDAYNANPSSMKAAIENFIEMPGKDKWLILGDMLELGEYAVQEHKEILQLVNAKQLNQLILVGELFLRAYSEMKWTTTLSLIFNNIDELNNLLIKDSPIHSPSWILLKGSRGIKLERCVEYL